MPAAASPHACLRFASYTTAPACALRKYVVALALDASPAERWAAAELLPILQRLACPREKQVGGSGGSPELPEHLG